MLVWVECAHTMKHNQKDGTVDEDRLQKQAVFQVKRITEPFIVCWQNITWLVCFLLILNFNFEMLVANLSVSKMTNPDEGSKIHTMCGIQRSPIQSKEE